MASRAARILTKQVKEIREKPKRMYRLVVPAAATGELQVVTEVSNKYNPETARTIQWWTLRTASSR